VHPDGVASVSNRFQHGIADQTRRNATYDPYEREAIVRAILREIDALPGE
jgi:hypothetical protein